MMNAFILHTLVDITDNGMLNKKFPFKTKSGAVVHDKHTLGIAKDQQNNFNTLIQSIQTRANITWKDVPVRTDRITANTKFGTEYTGKHTVWSFVFETEQAGVFENNGDPVAALVNDLDLIPVVNFCKETATFPKNAFLTQYNKFRNIYFLKAYEDDLENYPHI